MLKYIQLMLDYVFTVINIVLNYNLNNSRYTYCILCVANNKDLNLLYVAIRTMLQLKNSMDLCSASA